LSNPGGPTSFYPVELVPDIENMQILYGVDTSAGSTTAVNQYLTADQVKDFNTVMSVKVALLSASPIVASKNAGPGALTNVPSTAQTFSLLGTAVTAPLDTRLRRVFEVNIAVRNAVK
jgi:type IV pilus assembly protein PilW